MTRQSRADRGLRLHREAVNCIAIAVRENDTDTTALLIDEAIRLVRRSNELTAASGSSPIHHRGTTFGDT